MPGHIKLVKGAVDPDPTEFLWPSMDMKKEDQNKVSSSSLGVCLAVSSRVVFWFRRVSSGFVVWIHLTLSIVIP